MTSREPLPPGWEAVVDPDSGDTFYVNTKEDPPTVQWEDPRLSLPHASDPAPGPPRATTTPASSSANPFLSSSSSSSVPPVPVGGSYSAQFSEHPTPTPLLLAQQSQSQQSAQTRRPSTGNVPSASSARMEPVSIAEDDDLPPAYEDFPTVPDVPPSSTLSRPLPVPVDNLGSLPPGWIKIFDHKAHKWYFVDERATPPKITWDDPRTPRREVPPPNPHHSFTAPVPLPPSQSPYAPAPQPHYAPQPAYNTPQPWQQQPGSFYPVPPHPAGYPPAPHGVPPPMPQSYVSQYQPQYQQPQPYYPQPAYAPPVQYAPHQAPNTIIVVQPPPQRSGSYWF